MAHSPSKMPIVLSKDEFSIMVCAPRRLSKKKVKNWTDKQFPKLGIAKSWNIELCLNLFGPNGVCGESDKHCHYFLQPTTMVIPTKDGKMPKNENYDADGRELIGKVTLSSGEELKIYMPIFGDYFKIPIDSFDNIVPHLCAAATHKTVAELSVLPYPDGLVILEKLAPALQAMGDYLKTGAQHKKGK